MTVTMPRCVGRPRSTHSWRGVSPRRRDLGLKTRLQHVHLPSADVHVLQVGILHTHRPAREMTVPQGAADFDVDRRDQQRDRLIGCWSGASGAKYFKFRPRLPPNELPLDTYMVLHVPVLGNQKPVALINIKFLIWKNEVSMRPAASSAAFVVLQAAEVQRKPLTVLGGGGGRLAEGTSPSCSGFTCMPLRAGGLSLVGAGCTWVFAPCVRSGAGRWSAVSVPRRKAGCRGSGWKKDNSPMGVRDGPPGLRWSFPDIENKQSCDKEMRIDFFLKSEGDKISHTCGAHTLESNAAPGPAIGGRLLSNRPARNRNVRTAAQQPQSQRPREQRQTEPLPRGVASQPT